MRWQDYVFTLGSAILTACIIPMVRAKVKPPLLSSVPVFVILYVFAATYLTLGFVLAPIIETAQASLWLWLAVVRFRDDRRERKQQAAWTLAFDSGNNPLWGGIRVVTNPWVPRGRMFLVNENDVPVLKQFGGSWQGHTPSLIIQDEVANGDTLH